MGIVSRFERTLQSAVGDTFARVFGGNVVASEIESALQQQAADGLRKIGGRRVVPNEYTVTLGTSDYQQFKADEALAIKSFTKHLADYIAAQGWETDGPVRVSLNERSSLHTGQFRADGEMADPPQAAPIHVQSAGVGNGAPNGQWHNHSRDNHWDAPPQWGSEAKPSQGPQQAPRYAYPEPSAMAARQQPGRGRDGESYGEQQTHAAGRASSPSGPASQGVTLVLEDGSGRTYRLQRGSNFLGRGQDSHFRLPDTGVSRQHLDIYYDGQRAVLSDLGSTNGTTVNGGPVQDWQLAHGDVICLGHSEIVVHFS